MSNLPNFLRLYRKRSPLTQEDIAFLMEFPEYSNVSRYEKGNRAPSIEFILAYHYLFNTPIESFYEHHSQNVIVNLSRRIDDMLHDIALENNPQKHSAKITFLEEVLTRLNT